MDLKKCEVKISGFKKTNRKKNKISLFSFVITDKQTNERTNEQTDTQKKNRADSVGIRKKQIRATLRLAKIYCQILVFCEDHLRPFQG